MININKKGTIFNIQRYSLHDGPGIRITVFFQGCLLSCWWCHNPEGQSVAKKVAVAGAVAGESHSFVTVSEKIVSVEELMREIEKEIIFFEESGGGVTFSGGEPLMQTDFLSSMLDECKRKNIHTALDTSGYALPEDFYSIIDKVDLFLYDLKIIDDVKHEKYTGVSNKFILKNLETLSKRNKPVFIRFPVIPGITDTEENLEAVINFMVNLKNIKQINLLKYHRTAEGKYSKFHLKNRMADVGHQTMDKINAIRADFEKQGFDVKIGG